MTDNTQAPNALQSDPGRMTSQLDWLWPSPSTLFRWCIVVALAVFAVTTPGFLSPTSLRSLLSTASLVGCVAVGMTFVTMSGNIMSFSLGASLSATTVVFVWLLPYGAAAAVTGALLFGAGINAVQGLVIGYFRANPIIVSMAAFALILGVFTMLTGGRGIYITTNDAEIFNTNFSFVPGPLMAFAACALVGQAILRFTRFGRQVFLLGSNPRAALAAGMEPWRTVTWAYALAGLFTTVTAVLIASRYGSGDLQHGTGFEYQAISAVLVGGTAIQGGNGSVLRTFIGTMLIAIFKAVLILRGFSIELQQLLIGVVVLLVIMLQWRAGDLK